MATGELVGMRPEGGMLELPRFFHVVPITEPSWIQLNNQLGNIDFLPLKQDEEILVTPFGSSIAVVSRLAGDDLTSEIVGRFSNTDENRPLTIPHSGDQEEELAFFFRESILALGTRSDGLNISLRSPRYQRDKMVTPNGIEVPYGRFQMPTLVDRFFQLGVKK